MNKNIKTDLILCITNDITDKNCEECSYKPLYESGMCMDKLLKDAYETIVSLEEKVEGKK